MLQQKNYPSLGNDLLPCILTVDGDLENHDVSKLSKETLDTIEADSFWCMSKLLDGIQVIIIPLSCHFTK